MKRQLVGKQRRLRPIHKRIALHTSSLLLLLGGGFLPLPLSYQAQTYTMDVTARVAAPLPSEPALITSPHDQEHVTVQTITVTGTCPDDSYVKLYLGNMLVGVAACQNGTFTVTVTLAPGPNVLTAKVYNITDDEGPTSAPITVYYDPPTPAKPPASPAPAPSGGRKGLEVTMPPYEFTIRKPGESWQWDITISGGTTPYEVLIEWGDGQIMRLTRRAAGPFTINHTFAHTGTYQPLLRVTDADGTIATLQLLAEVRERITPAISWIRDIGNLNPWIAWPIYVALLTGVGAVWIWEIGAFRKHLAKLRSQHKPSAHHA